MASLPAGTSLHAGVQKGGEAVDDSIGVVFEVPAR